MQKILRVLRKVINKTEIKILIGFLLILAIITPLMLYSLDKNFWMIFLNNSIILSFILFNAFIRNLFYKIGLRIEYFYIKYIDSFFEEDMEEYKELDVGIQRIREASFKLASMREGALICFERKYSLDKYTKESVSIDAEISQELILSLFNKNSPLHDGAVIIRENRIKFASTYFPITQNKKNILKKTSGSRHRAGLGITEETDAVVILVSEEKGTVHIISEGVLSSALDRNEFNSLLLSALK